MLPKKHRLPGNQIPEVIKKGKRYSFPLFNIVVLELQATRYRLQVSRFAFVVSLKMDKRATVRNRTKRLLSEAVRRLLPQIKKDLDIILFAKKTLKEEGLDEVLPQVEKSLQKAKIL